MRYLLNAPVLGCYGSYRFLPSTAAHLARWSREGFVSAIGHPASALLLSERLGVPVPIIRQSVSLQVGDEALVLRLTRRLPEGCVLEADDLRRWPYELAWLQRMA